MLKLTRLSLIYSAVLLLATLGRTAFSPSKWSRLGQTPPKPNATGSKPSPWFSISNGRSATWPVLCGLSRQLGKSAIFRITTTFLPSATAKNSARGMLVKRLLG